MLCVCVREFAPRGTQKHKTKVTLMSKFGSKDDPENWNHLLPAERRIFLKQTNMKKAKCDTRVAFKRVKIGHQSDSTAYIYIYNET